MVECQLKLLRSCRDPKDIKKALYELPGELNAMYDRILGKIDKTDRWRARCVLRLIAVACRPLTIDEMREALTVDLKNERIDPERRMMEPLDIVKICSTIIELNGCSSFLAS